MRSRLRRKPLGGGRKPTAHHIRQRNADGIPPDGEDAVVTSRDSQEDAHPDDALHDVASRRNPIAGQRQPLPDYVVFSQLSVISTVIPIFPPKLPNYRDVTLPSA